MAKPTKQKKPRHPRNPYVVGMLNRQGDGAHRDRKKEKARHGCRGKWSQED